MTTAYMKDIHTKLSSERKLLNLLQKAKKGNKEALGRAIDIMESRVNSLASKRKRFSLEKTDPTDIWVSP